MNKILDYFENMDEAVYISDMETYDLVYMNESLKNHFDYQSHEEYSGKKCYEVIHGFNEPCPFCNNKKLKDKNWVSWIYTSPKLCKQFLIKDRVFHFNGRQYRIELSLDIDGQQEDGGEHYNFIYDSIVNECLRETISTSNADETIEQILTYIGTKFLCDRVYVFELHDNGFLSNTYEWCAEGILPQKEILQNESIESVDWWIEKFKQNEIVLIEDLEKIKTEHPTTYSVLKPQKVSALAVVPIRINHEIRGFVGVDNPNRKMFHLIRPLLSVVETIIPLLLKRRELFNRLERMSFHDSLTGSFNRNALLDFFENTSQFKSLGLMYCDITGLKRINDTKGHEAGDFMIRKCYNYIHDFLKTDQIYRIGGDEFVSIYPNCSKEDFYKQVEALKENIQTYQYHIAVGEAWSDEKPFIFDQLITRADKHMYQDKREYYFQNHMTQGMNFRAFHIPEDLASFTCPDQFMAAICHNTDVFFRSIAENNTSSYFYFGDIQKNLYYISDNLRDEFGFDGNIVPNFPQVWGKFIAVPQLQKTYMQKLDGIMRGECSHIDLRYLVRDIGGKAIWVHHYSISAGEEEKGIPVFISGRIAHQDNRFVVDPVTNFPRESVLWERLENVDRSSEICSLIGFRFNYITEINAIHGRKYVDRMLNDIAALLLERLSDKMSFYRLEGTRCVAVLMAEYSEQQEVLIRQIREIVEESYRRHGLFFPYPCAIAFLEYPNSALTIDEFRVNLEALLKTAKSTPTREYLDDSSICPQAMKKRSNMELVLNENVMHGMENFRIVVQPVVSTENGKIKGGEVLMRWKYQDKDVSPTVFIPLLEKSDMIQIAGRWVFDQAVRTCSRIISYFPDFYISFNVSLCQLKDTSFAEFIHETIEKYHMDGSHLVAEITESCLDEEPEMLTLFVQACKKIGVRIALDDFGSGYSSLRMLLQYPYNIVKLDRSLLQDITVSDQNQSFIRSIVYTCRQCNKQVCVEGVETDEENSIIKDTDCNTIQGYYYHKPMELHQLYELISKSDS